MLFAKAGVLLGSLFVRAFRAVVMLAAWYSGCVGAALCCPEDSNL